MYETPKLSQNRSCDGGAGGNAPNREPVTFAAWTVASGNRRKTVPAAPKEIASSWKIARIIRSPDTADGAKDNEAAMAGTLKSRPLVVNHPHETP
jgi:hypothetical protein